MSPQAARRRPGTTRASDTTFAALGALRSSAVIQRDMRQRVLAQPQLRMITNTLLPTLAPIRAQCILRFGRSGRSRMNISVNWRILDERSGEEMPNRIYPFVWQYLQKRRKRIEDPNATMKLPGPTVLGPHDSIPTRLNELNAK